MEIKELYLHQKTQTLRQNIIATEKDDQGSY